MVSGIATVVSESPVIGSSNEISASAGIVYSALETHVIGWITQRRRYAKIAIGNEIASATTTETSVSQKCWAPRDTMSSR